MEYQKISNIIDVIIDRRGVTATKLGGKWEQEGIPVISANNIRNGKFVDMDSLKYVKKEIYDKWMPKRLQKGDILLVSEGATFGELLYLDEDYEMVLGQRLFALRCNRNYTSRYLYYYLKSNRGQYELNSRTTGTSVLGIRQSELRKIMVPISLVNDQNIISNMLGALDDKITINSKINVLYEEIAEILFKRWFIDFEFPNDEEQPYFTTGGLMKSTPHDNIPEQWHKVELKDHISIFRGVSYRSHELKKSNNALVTLKSINRGGGFNYDGFKEYVGKYKKENVLKRNDIVVSQTDVTQRAEVIGKPARIPKIKKYNKLIASLDIINIKSKNDVMKNTFLYQLLKSYDFQSHISGYTKGTTVLHLDRNGINTYEYIMPDNETIKKFDNIISIFWHEIDNNNLENEILTEIREMLLPRLMSGEIQVLIEGN